MGLSDQANGLREKHEKATSRFPSSSEAEDDEFVKDAGTPTKKRRINGVREAWSDSDGEDAGAAAFKKFSNRSTKARIKATANMKRARAVRKLNVTKARGQNGRTQRAATVRNSVMGNQKDDSSEGENDLIPEYIARRRKVFQDRQRNLREAGLALPPTFENEYFSDEEGLEHLKERPQLRIVPPAPRQDVNLPYSLGVIPAPVAQYLRPYQVQGVAFLHELYVYQKGGILGDDMGLGKTIQVIAFLIAAFGKTGDERDRKRMHKIRRQDLPYPRVLIICPGTLMDNWLDELQRWGWWHAEKYYGSGRDQVLAAAKSGMLEIMVTTYATYRESSSSVNLVAWDCVIADECHIIKERKSSTTKAMNEVNALCRIGLTGTAIQNKYEELWTLLNWTNPGTFGPISTWKISICEPLKIGQSHNATSDELSRARQTARKLVENLLPQFFLRRMKTLIKDQLPKKTDRVVFCPLTNVQAEAYSKFVNSDIVDMIKSSGQVCDCGSGKKRGWCHYKHLEGDEDATWQKMVFPAIQTCQKLASHLALLIPHGNDTREQKDKTLELLRLARPDDWENLYNTRDSILNLSNPDFCGKWKVMQKLLKFWDVQNQNSKCGDNNKVLVFSHSVRLLKMLQQLFIATSYSVAYLDGSLDYEDRYAVVQDFNTDPDIFVFLISTRAGGTGLNITSANKVIVVDPNWNPSYDLQAQDRAYRIGQARDVEVFRLVSQGTLEEIVYARQIYKQQQSNIGYNATSERRYFQGIQDRPDQKGEIFGLQNMFTFDARSQQKGGRINLQDVIHKTNVAESRADIAIAELQLNDEEDIQGTDDDQNEDQAMSQLAAEITGDVQARKRDRKTKKEESAETSFLSTTSADVKHDPVQAILASAGVKYTHDNSEVIGSSRIEAALSKKAEEGGVGYDARHKVFASQSQPQNDEHGSEGRKDGGLKYRYRPSEEIKRRQFCSMAKWAGEHDITVFALRVEGMTQAERRDLLEKWYKHRRAVIVSNEEELHVNEELKYETYDRAKSGVKPDAVVQGKERDDAETETEDDEL